MAETSRGMLFRKRNILGAALVAGIGLGIYLGPLFKGFGLGGGSHVGIGTSDGETQASLGSADSIEKPLEPTKTDEPVAVPDVVRVLIDDRQFFLRDANGNVNDVPIALPKLIELIEQAPGDDDGIRVRIYQKASARASAEESLKKSLATAGIPDTAVFWVPTPVK